MSIYYCTELKFFVQTCTNQPLDECVKFFLGLHRKELVVHKNRTALVEVEEDSDTGNLKIYDVNSADWLTLGVFYDEDSKMNVVSVQGYDTYISTYGFSRAVVLAFKASHE